MSEENSSKWFEKSVGRTWIRGVSVRWLALIIIKTINYRRKWITMGEMRLNGHRKKATPSQLNNEQSWVHRQISNQFGGVRISLHWYVASVCVIIVAAYMERHNHNTLYPVYQLTIGIRHIQAENTQIETGKPWSQKSRNKTRRAMEIHSKKQQNSVTKSHWQAARRRAKHQTAQMQFGS